MAAHRRPKPPRRGRLAALATAAGAASLLPAQAHAEPKPSVDEVRKRVAELYEAAEAPTEEYNSVQERQQTLQSAADRAQDRLSAKQAEINELRRAIGPLAAAQYRDGALDPGVRLFLSADPDAYLEQAEMMGRLSARQASRFDALRSKQRELAQARTEAATRLAAVEQTRREVGARKREIQDRLAEAQRLLNDLTADEREQLRDAEAAADRTAGGSDSAATYNGPASGRARTAIEFAYAQLGKPYEWGSTGPDSYDCSGLTGAAWRAAGVSLPRTTGEQYATGRKVARPDLQPGDIVFFYSPSQHNGLYIGDGKILHAPRTGKNVEIVGIGTMPYYGAIRP
ncbi:NlpC/P60 family protein [Streptomyces sp. NPDC051940]|uniref:C40 family peptidase n=1 Tax=Streptomyces sp. NPDC051940 TaxID=3155675 RepID=UPI00343F4C91